MFAGLSDVTRFSGCRIFEDANLLRPTGAPKRIHKLRPRMKLAYHKRIQKKWIKRYGYVMEPYAVSNGAGDFICHPAIAQTLRDRYAI